MTHTTIAPKATLVIFGITGDLSHRLLMPALINMTRDGLIGEDLTVLGVGRSEGDDEALRISLEDFQGKAGGEGEIDLRDEQLRAAWQSLRQRVAYVRGDFTDAKLYEQLSIRLDSSNVVFYLATAPHFFGDIVEQLANAGLLEEGKGFRRIAIEKPFAHDHASARVLNQRILALASEQQIYRVDHFLGKETVQNIMVTRFANPMIEAVWNNRYIDHVQITVAETVDVGTRGKFYDATGALRDMVPNHLFQVLAMIGMEPPSSLDVEAIRDEKVKILKAIRGPAADTVESNVVRGVYTEGCINDKFISDYRAAEDVAADSATETYIALKLHIDTERWHKVPFYLRTGKALSQRDSQIIISFKPVDFAPFDKSKPCANKLVIQLLPDEGLALDFAIKRPGPGLTTAPVRMNFKHADVFDIAHLTGYETLLYDVMTGDQTLFRRAEETEAAWRALQPVLDAWATGGKPDPYAAGSNGPFAAETLIERDGRHWQGLGR